MSVHPPAAYINGNLETHHLKNGCSIVLMDLPAAKEYLVELVYGGIGSAMNLDVGKAGLAHVLEHMKCRPAYVGDSSRARGMMRGMNRWVELGGSYQNASTDSERMCFYSIVPKSDIDTAVAIYVEQHTGDALRQDEVAAELPAVLNEMDRGKLAPIRKIQALLQRLVSLHSPQGSHTTIGFRKAVESVTAETLNAFNTNFMTTDRATMVIAGNFSDAAFKDTVRKNLKAQWGSMEKSECKCSRYEFAEMECAAPSQNVSTMIMDEPGFNFLMTAVPMPLATTLESVHYEMAAVAMGHHLGDVEVQARRSSAANPTLVLAMNCEGDINKAHESIRVALNRSVPNIEAFNAAKGELYTQYSGAFLSPAQLAEVLASHIAFNETCGALGAHDIVNRLDNLTKMSYGDFTKTWNLIATDLKWRSSTVHAISAERVGVRLPERVRTPIAWAKPARAHIVDGLVPRVVTAVDSVQAQSVYPVVYSRLRTLKANFSARFACSRKFAEYLKCAVGRAPCGVRARVSYAGGDSAVAHIEAVWHETHVAARWFVGVMTGTINENAMAQAAHVARRYSGGNQQAVGQDPSAVSENAAASLFSGDASMPVFDGAGLCSDRDYTLHAGFMVTMHGPGLYTGVRSHSVDATMEQAVGILKRGLRLVPVEYTKAFEPKAFPAGSTVVNNVGAPISVTCIKFPVTPCRGAALANVTVLNEALGGDFNSMLMKHCRGDLGYTYGVSSRLDTENMNVTMSATFAHGNHKNGTASMIDVIHDFENITEKQLLFGKQCALMRVKSLSDIPEYIVGHADFLLRIGSTEEEWVSLLSNVTYESARKALATHVHTNTLYVAVSK